MPDNLLEIIHDFSKHRIAVIGDLMLDRFIYGTVDRISPEAPIPVLRIQRETTTLGGAGNVVRNIAALHANVDVMAVMGQDQAGTELKNQFGSLNGVTSLILTDPNRPTTLKLRYIAGSQQLLRADQEDSRPLGAAQEKDLINNIQNSLKRVDIAILSDYAKGTLTSGVIAATLNLAAQMGKKVLIDPKGKDFSRYRGAYMLTPNRKELTEATGVDRIKTVEQAEAAARVLITAYNIEVVLAKLGADGVCLVQREKPALHIPTQAREVFDVSGAGDTVVATMAVALAAGASLENAARLANLAGSIVVGKIGTAIVNTDDLTRALREQAAAPGETKLVSWNEAKDMAARWRAQGLKVGFTNGCFDLIHPGHLSLLHQARAKCDRLIVGLNTDSSVKRLKGPSRPVQNEVARATVLSAMTDVDLVVLFDQDTPYDIIRDVQPHLLVKGADYTPENVVGWDLVQSWGGELLLAQLTEGQSTSKLIARSQTPETRAAKA